jgi:hypothetical protein
VRHQAKTFLAALGLALAILAPTASWSQTTQCIASAAAQGTPNAITIAALPCALTTNLLILTAAGANTSTTPTLQPLGLPAQTIVRPDGSQLNAGDIGGAGYKALLNPTGSVWVLLNPATVPPSDLPLFSAPGVLGATAAGPTTQLSQAQLTGLLTGTLPSGLSAPNFVIAPTANTLNPGLSINQSLAGSVTGDFGLNNITISADNAAASAQVNAGISALTITHNFGGSAMTGFRTPLFVHAILTAKTGNTSSTHFYTGEEVRLDINAPDNGTSGTPLNGVAGSNIVVSLNTGATNYFVQEGYEADVGGASGTSVANRLGFISASFGLENGSSNDIAFEVAALPGSVGWNCGFCVSALNGSQPISATGTIFGISGALTTSPNYGVDLIGPNFGVAAFASNGFLVDGLGGMQSCTHNLQTNPASTSSGGMFCQSNFINGGGDSDVDFFNLFNNAPVSFAFFQKTGASSSSELASFGTSGIVFVPSVSAAAVGVTSLTDSGVTGSTQCAQFNSAGLLSGTGASCGGGITALTGDVTATGPGSVAATLATVNANVGTFGSATQVMVQTVNAKGLTTAASNVSIAIALSQVTSGFGTGVATALANAVNASGGVATSAVATLSSLSSIGTITTGVWQGTIISAAFGGTGVNNGSNALTVPATGTADLLGTAQTLSALKTFNGGILIGTAVQPTLVTGQGGITGSAAGGLQLQGFGSTFDIFANNRSGATVFVVPTNTQTFQFQGALFSGGAAPTCGTGCASVTGSSTKFVVTAGTAVTSITVNFAASYYTSAPVCSIGSGSTASVVDVASVTASAITLGASVALTGGLTQVICIQ